MLQQEPSLDRVFHALADPGRLSMVSRLSEGPASVSELAEPLSISLSAVGQHLKLLESCGLVVTQKTGRTRVARLRPETLSAAEQWIADRRSVWVGRLDRLEALIDDDAF